MPIMGQVDEHGLVWTRERLTFARLYVAGVDPSSAARDAKLPESEDVDELIKHPGFVVVCQRIHEYVLQKAAESEDSVIARLANWAQADVYDFFTWREGIEPGTMAELRLKDVSNMPKFMRQRVKSIESKTTVNAAGERTTNYKLEVHDAMRANIELAKLLGIGGVATEDAEDVANAIYEFLQEVEGIRAVEDGEFPPQEQVDV